MLKVLYFSPRGFAEQATLKALEGVATAQVDTVRTLEECIAGVPDADILVTGDAPPAEAEGILRAAQAPGARIRAIHFLSAGRDGFHTAGIPEGIAVTGPDGALAPTVAEHGMALMLALGRQIGALTEAAANAQWDRSVLPRMRSIEGLTAVIVGLGSIGRELARRLRPFGVRTVGLQRTARPDDSVDELGAISGLDRFLPDADILVLAVALAPETTGMIDEARLGRMKQSALLVNVARGGLVDHHALAKALEDGALGGAALDVTDPEPLPQEHPLWKAPNLVLSPHLAGAGSAAAMTRIGQSVADRVRELNGTN